MTNLQSELKSQLPDVNPTYTQLRVQYLQICTSLILIQHYTDARLARFKQLFRCLTRSDWYVVLYLRQCSHMYRTCCSDAVWKRLRCAVVHGVSG